MFQGITLREFNQKFQSEFDCKNYLYRIKWSNGFCCRRCGCLKCWRGRTEFHARCVECDYDESVTANTVFHKLQIRLTTAFSMVFQIAVYKKGISALELSRLFRIDEKTAARFRKKCQEAMGAWVLEESTSKEGEKLCGIDGITFSHRTEGASGLQRSDVVLEKYMKNRPRREFIRCVNLIPFEDKMDPCRLDSGRYVDHGKDIRVWNLRKWLGGTHHHCSAKYSQNYSDEFFFRFNNRHRLQCIWHTLICKMMAVKPPYLKLNAVR